MNNKGTFKYLKRFPFFQVEYSNHQDRIFRSFALNHKAYNSEEHIRRDLTKLIIRECKQILKLDRLSDMKRLKIVRVRITNYGGNIGSGKYLYQYKWLQGRHIPTYPVANYYSIRFNKDTSDQYIQHKAKVILKRHARRLLKHLNQQ